MRSDRSAKISHNAVLNYLMDVKRKGTLPGIIGRLVSVFKYFLSKMLNFISFIDTCLPMEPKGSVCYAKSNLVTPITGGLGWH